MKNIRRADIVIVDFRQVNPSASVRPALVIQNDRDNLRMLNTIVAQITTNLRRSGEDTQLLIDATHSDWAKSGLLHASVVNCSNIYTIHERIIRSKIGSLTPATMQDIDDCLKAALEIS